MIHIIYVGMYICQYVYTYMHGYTYICIDTCSGISVPEGYKPETNIHTIDDIYR
jgi:hypothetical protein